MTLYHEGHPCYCGRRGCAEQYLSAPALEAFANTRIYSQIETRPDTRKIFELYKLMDPIALAIVKEYRKNLAFFLGSLTCCLDPHYFVFGGGLSLQNDIYDNLAEEIAKNTYLPKETAKIYKHKIGDSAGAIGASLIIKQKYES
jgi:predicted NBD/HSP70 family sugar kinase